MYHKPSLNLVEPSATDIIIIVDKLVKELLNKEPRAIIKVIIRSIKVAIALWDNIEVIINIMKFDNCKLKDYDKVVLLLIQISLQRFDQKIMVYC